MLLICALLLSSFVEGSQQTELPAFVRQCKNDARVSECAKRALDDLRPYLVKGIPEFHLPPIDPLHISLITLEPRNSKIANYRAELTNTVWTGTKNFEVLDAYVDTERLVYRLTLKFQNLLANTHAYTNGTLLSFDIDGAGTADVNLENVIFTIILNGERFLSKGRKFSRWINEDVEITYGAVNCLEINGFFNDPAITHLFKLAVNRGARLLGSQFRASLSSISNFIIEAINQVHAIYPSNVLYV